MDCRICEKYMTDKDWRLTFGRDDMPELRILNCGPSFLAPCRDKSRGCPKGTPENQKVLSEENRQCYEHYLECVAVGEFPDDSVVRRNAVVIRELIESHEKQKTDKFRESILDAINEL